MLEIEEVPAIGQHLLCPLCDVKFSYTPQDMAGNSEKPNDIESVEMAGTEDSCKKIKTACPHCGTAYDVEADYIGETATCGTCGNTFVVKEPEVVEPSEEPSSDGAMEESYESVPDEAGEKTAVTLGKGRFGAFCTKVKTATNTAMDKTVHLWESGWRGRSVIIGFAVLLVACLFAPLISHRSADADYEMGLRYLNGDGVAKDMVKATYLFRNAAEQGNVEAQFQLGAIYGSMQDWKEAAKWYQAAAGQGHSKAKFGLGFCYIFGLGVSKDESKGTQLLNEAKKDPQLQSQIQDLLNHFQFSNNNLPCPNVDGVWNDKPQGFEQSRQAAERDDAESQFELGRRYVEGDGVDKNWPMAIKCFRKAAEQNHPRAQYELGSCYRLGFFVTKDIEESIKWIRKAAEQGYVNAQFDLGASYFNGDGMPQDKTEATKWFHKAAEQGYVQAQYHLAQCYNEGVGVPQNKIEAIRWYRKAADQGFAEAQYDLGCAYSEGVGVPQNKSEAARWYRKAAEQGYANAQNNLGNLYKSGQGVAQDHVEAVKWFRKAAEQGVDTAQFNLGLCYSKGDGVAQDLSEAVRWFRKSADQGWAPAQFNLGISYFYGLGTVVPKDKTEAAKWFSKAAEQGHRKAQELLIQCRQYDL